MLVGTDAYETVGNRRVKHYFETTDKEPDSSGKKESEIIFPSELLCRPYPLLRPDLRHLNQGSALGRAARPGDFRNRVLCRSLT